MQRWPARYVLDQWLSGDVVRVLLLDQHIALAARILWAFYLAVARRRLSFAALTGGLVGISFLAGQLQFALGYVVALAVMAFGQTLYLWRRRGNLSSWPLLCFLISAGCGILIAGIQLLPFAEFLSLTRRESTGGQTVSLLAAS